MAVKKKEEMVEEIIVAEEPKATVESFIDRKLYSINEMENKAKARKLAERVLANRKGK